MAPFFNLLRPQAPLGVHRPIPQRRDSIDVLFSALEMMIQNNVPIFTPAEQETRL